MSQLERRADQIPEVVAAIVKALRSRENLIAFGNGVSTTDDNCSSRSGNLPLSPLVDESIHMQDGISSAR